VLHGGRRTPLEPDRALVIPPHTAYATELSQPCDHMFVHFLLGRDFVVEPALYVCAAPQDLCEAARRACRKVPGGPAAALVLQRYVVTMLAEIPAEHWQEPVRDPRLRRALKAMEQSPAAPPDNTELARVASLSTNGFVRLFRQKMGVPPQAYQMKWRLERACAALVNTHKSVETIAQQTGFCDRAHLTRMFRKYLHNTPGAYRREHSLA
jgi:transcriptional regulator GlxA family with amidase domain